jgi:hypothetical protein
MVHGMPASEEASFSVPTTPAPTSSNPTPADDGLPRKRILSQAHLKAFKESETYKDIVEFVEELNAAIVGKKLSDTRMESPVSNLRSLSRAQAAE